MPASRPVAYRQHEEPIIGAQVDAAQFSSPEDRRPIEGYLLRDLEETARTTCDRREAIQLGAAERRVPGDRGRAGRDDGAFAYRLGAAA